MYNLELQFDLELQFQVDSDSGNLFLDAAQVPRPFDGGQPRAAMERVAASVLLPHTYAPSENTARLGGNAGRVDLMALVDWPVPFLCEQCGVSLPLAELRRRGLAVFDQELVEVDSGDRVGYACPECAKRGLVGVMCSSRSVCSSRSGPTHVGGGL
jgi:hypothetical protein